MCTRISEKSQLRGRRLIEAFAGTFIHFKSSNSTNVSYYKKKIIFCPAVGIHPISVDGERKKK